MGIRGQFKTQDEKIQGIIGRYLDLRSTGESKRHSTGHPHEDILNAFVEGSLSEREAIPMVEHLSGCGFCRHITAELVRLDLALSEIDAPAITAETREPAKVSEVLSGILSKIFGTGEAAVFAHEEPKKDDEKKIEPDKE